MTMGPGPNHTERRSLLEAKAAQLFTAIREGRPDSELFPLVESINALANSLKPGCRPEPPPPRRPRFQTPG
jgi:hypothetical protein